MLGGVEQRKHGDRPQQQGERQNHPDRGADALPRRRRGAVRVCGALYLGFGMGFVNRFARLVVRSFAMFVVLRRLARLFVLRLAVRVMLAVAQRGFSPSPSAAVARPQPRRKR